MCRTLNQVKNWEIGLTIAWTLISYFKLLFWGKIYKRHSPEGYAVFFRFNWWSEMKKLVRLLSGLFIILVFIAAITFSYINSTPVKISFGSWEFQEVPVSAWIIAAFVVGGFLGLGLGLGIWRNFRSKSEIKRLQKQLANSQQEVIKLRAISIKDLQ